MNRAFSTALAGLLLLLAGLAGWRIVVTSMATWWAPENPERALAWEPDYPPARLSIAQARLDAGEPEAAAAMARGILQQFPLQAEALVVLARAADASGTPAVQALFQTALRRYPRSQYAHAWMIGELLGNGRHAEALAQVSALLGFAPWLTEDLVSRLVQASADPEFASAVPIELSRHPGWRAAYLATLLNAGQPEAIDAVHGRLQDRQELPDDEARNWFYWMKRNGRWGEAYSQWVSRLRLPEGVGLALVHDGGFETAPTGIGFDWQMHSSPEALVERIQKDGGAIVQVTFLGRRAARIGLSQDLLLAPGRYRLTFRTAARGLRSDKGLQWSLRCHGPGQMQSGTELLQGSFDWKKVQLEFEVPMQDCPAQELALINPGAEGAGKIVSGTLWLDDVSIVPIPPHSTPALH